MYIQSVECDGKDYIGFELQRRNNIMIEYSIILIDSSFNNTRYRFYNSGRPRRGTIETVKIDGIDYNVSELFMYLDKNKDSVYNLLRMNYYDYTDYCFIDSFICFLTRDIDLSLRQDLTFEVMEKLPYDNTLVLIKDICDTLLITEAGVALSLIDYITKFETYFYIGGDIKKIIRVSVKDIDVFKKFKSLNKAWQAKQIFMEKQSFYGKVYGECIFKV